MTQGPGDSDAVLDAALAEAVAVRRAKVEFRGVGNAVIRVRKPLALWQHAIFLLVAVVAFAARFYALGALVVLVWALAIFANGERYRLTFDATTGEITEEIVT